MVSVVHKQAMGLYVALGFALAVGVCLALVSQGSPYRAFIAGMALVAVFLVLPAWLLSLVLTTRHWQDLDARQRLFAGIPLALVAVIVLAVLVVGLV